MTDPIRMTWQMYLVGICSYRGRLVQLTRMEAEIVATLLIRRGRRMTIPEIIEAVYPDPDREPDTAYNCVAVLLSRVRRKMPGLVETIGCQGYVIERPLEELRQAA